MSGQNFLCAKKTIAGSFESNAAIIASYNCMFNLTAIQIYRQIFFMTIRVFFFRFDFY